MHTGHQTFPDGVQAHQWDKATLHQGMRQYGEDGPVTLSTRQGEVVMRDGDWVVTHTDGSRSVVRRETAQAAGWERRCAGCDYRPAQAEKSFCATCERLTAAR